MTDLCSALIPCYVKQRLPTGRPIHKDTVEYIDLILRKKRVDGIPFPHISTRQDDYVEIARKLTEDKSKLSKLRPALREAVISSPLCQGPGYTRTIEAAYRDMWHRWCAKS